MTLAHQSYVHEIPNLLTVGALSLAVAITFVTAISLRVNRAK